MGFLDAHHAQRLHSFIDSLVLDHDRGCALDDQTPDRFRNRQRFDNREPAEITAALAPVAAGAVVKRAGGVAFNPSLPNASASG